MAGPRVNTGREQTSQNTLRREIHQLFDQTPEVVFRIKNACGHEGASFLSQARRQFAGPVRVQNSVGIRSASAAASRAWLYG